MTMLALQRARRHAPPDDFPEQLTELLALLEGRVPPEHPLVRHAGLLPGRPERPEPWLLGSSPQSAVWAGELGLPYAIADFINPNGAALAAEYRSRFVDSERLAAPTS
jgi:alkanesulfonate monooxygenase SsuD/methylene tetrahydromethanopterin reductase-like flavin-dependent oxidoreductase (luciferase family)